MKASNLILQFLVMELNIVNEKCSVKDKLFGNSFSLGQIPGLSGVYQNHNSLAVQVDNSLYIFCNSNKVSIILDCMQLLIQQH